jgi:hypothetical protein
MSSSPKYGSYVLSAQRAQELAAARRRDEEILRQRQIEAARERLAKQREEIRAIASELAELARMVESDRPDVAQSVRKDIEGLLVTVEGGGARDLGAALGRARSQRALAVEQMRSIERVRRPQMITELQSTRARLDRIRETAASLGLTDAQEKASGLVTESVRLMSSLDGAKSRLDGVVADLHARVDLIDDMLGREIDLRQCRNRFNEIVSECDEIPALADVVRAENHDFAQALADRSVQGAELVVNRLETAMTQAQDARRQQLMVLTLLSQSFEELGLTTSGPEVVGGAGHLVVTTVAADGRRIAATTAQTEDGPTLIYHPEGVPDEADLSSVAECDDIESTIEAAHTLMRSKGINVDELTWRGKKRSNSRPSDPQAHAFEA